MSTTGPRGERLRQSSGVVVDKVYTTVDAALATRWAPWVDRMAVVLRWYLRAIAVALTVLFVVLGGSLIITGIVAMIVSDWGRWVATIGVPVWLVVAIYTEVRYRRMSRAIRSTEQFRNEFFAVVDLRALNSAGLDVILGAGEETGFFARLRRAYRLYRLFTTMVDDARGLPCIGPLLPSARWWSRLWATTTGIVGVALAISQITAAVHGVVT